MEVLVIDDEQSITDALQMILSDNGHQVVVGASGRDGLDQASRRRFDLMITDVRLPDMSGMELLSTLRHHHPDCFVIVITAHGTPELAAESAARGAFHLLNKPFSPAELLAIIQDIAVRRFSSC